MDGGFGRERSFTGLSGGEDNGRGVQIGCLVPNCRRALFFSSSTEEKTRIMPVEYPAEMDLSGAIGIGKIRLGT